MNMKHKGNRISLSLHNLTWSQVSNAQLTFKLAHMLLIMRRVLGILWW